MWIIFASGLSKMMLHSRSLTSDTPKPVSFRVEIKAFVGMDASLNIFWVASVVALRTPNASPFG